MPDWIAPVAICLLVVLLMTLSEWLERRRASAETPTKATVPSERREQPKPDPSPDSIEIEIVTVTVPSPSAGTKPAAKAPAVAADDLPRLDEPEEDAVDPTRVGKRAGSIQPPTKRIVYDADAANDEPTNPGFLFLVNATAQTDKGMRRKRNEDSLLVMERQGVFVVADGMGGYRGGEIASKLAVQTIQEAFEKENFAGEPHDAIPRRASEMARAIQMANEAILDHAATDKALEGMGTTVCAARFSPDKQRLYVAHVGDSRMYRVRARALRQMTSDHTMKDLGVTGHGSDHLSRAVGVWPTVPIDILLAKPVPGDLYLLCSDGLTKMIDDETLARLLSQDAEPSKLVDDLIRHANERGGKDNITAILVRVLRASNESKPP